MQFRSERDELLVPAALLDHRQSSAQGALSRVLGRYLEERLARLPDEHDFLSRFRNELGRALGQGQADLDHLAKRLGMSARTLRRRLREHDTTHRQEQDSVRRRLAMHHLRRREFSIGEIAFLLGYSEPSAFHRAFRRWTGTTAMAWRREEREGREPKQTGRDRGERPADRSEPPA